MLFYFFGSEFRNMLIKNYEGIFSCGAGHGGLAHKQSFMCLSKDRPIQLFFPQLLVSVKQL